MGKRIVLGVFVAAIAGCTAAPYNIIKDSSIAERVQIESVMDGYHLTFSKPNGEVTRRLWCDLWENHCIEAK